MSESQDWVEAGITKDIHEKPKNQDKQDWNKLDRDQFIALVTDRTCHCDVMNNYDCGHTRIFDELQKRIPK